MTGIFSRVIHLWRRIREDRRAQRYEYALFDQMDDLLRRPDEIPAALARAQAQAELQAQSRREGGDRHEYGR